VPVFIALLRGVNVGKGKRVPMAELRALLTGLGYTDVRTLLNSGNAVFRASRGTSLRIASDIAAALQRRLGIAVPVIVKSARELDAIVAGVPVAIEDAHRSRFLVAFAPDRNGLAGLAAIRPLVGSRERFVIGRHAAYLYCAAGILESKAGSALLGRLGQNATTRNLATTLKLHALVQA
jgi:uncharacterized protein (DUF1697 family)